jgi:hypothetical protein
MDALFWGPHWYAPSDDEFLPKVQRALEQGNRSGCENRHHAAA